MWGYFDPRGGWQSNPRIGMSAEEQRRQNAENGYVMARPLPKAVEFTYA